MKTQSNQEPKQGCAVGLACAALLTAGTVALACVNWLLVPALFCVACLPILASRLWHRIRQASAPRRVLGAILLLFYRPRKNREPHLHAFCYDNHVGL